MAIKLTPELLRILNNEEETNTAEELKKSKTELIREKIKTENARREKLLNKPEKPETAKNPEKPRKPSPVSFALGFTLCAALADIAAVLYMMLFMF